MDKKKLYLILILGLLSAIGPLSIDMYLPAFPDIAKGLHTSVSSVMLSLSSFFIGISVGQLIYGPLLERFGRKKPLYFGLVLYALSSLACAIALSVDTLIIFRLFQALGGCVGMVAARAMVRDLFELKDNAKVFSTLMLVVAVSPIIAPTLGGYITLLFGWRYIFGALVVVIVLIIGGIYFLLPESKQPDPNFSLRPKAILKGYSTVIKNSQFAIYTFTSAVAYSGLYAYISGSPYVFMVLFKVSENYYSWIFATIAIGLIGSSQFNTFILRWFSSEKIIQWALLIQNIVAVVLLAITLLGWGNLYSTIILVFFFMCCQGFLFPNATALSMAPFSSNAGSASALMGFIQMSIGAFMSAMVSFLQNETALPMIGIMAFCSLFASVLFYFGRKKIKKQASATLVKEEEIEMISTL
ncbi:multidrug effflux MFS transporter [Flavobacterium sp.]|uniref:multidrug effflux MFS transporter n=1 Tax=Flavobacterium sp. TaxID=239 RepID=UPI00286EBDB3|nr:multidrug effflux MFS transporter [Flavobacterium sp.]